MEFFSVMLKLWNEYWKLFLQGLGMTLFMGFLTVLLSTVFGAIMALMRRSKWGIGKFHPLNAIAAVYVEIIRGTPIFLLFHAASVGALFGADGISVCAYRLLRQLYGLCV